MIQHWFDLFWHKRLGRPYRAHCAFDVGAGPTVVLLHGLGAGSGVWQPLTPLLVQNYRVVAFDLLGFGASPKPTWIDYSVEDHARAVLAAMHRRRVKGPLVIIGHSMGGLVAVHIARLRPHLVTHLILYEMPLYADIPALRKYTMLRSLYFAVYKRILKYPKYSPKNARLVQKLAARLVGFTISKQTWTPFVKSLKHTIMEQTTLEDMRRLDIPVDVIYGTRDAVVIRGKPRLIFGPEATHITTHVITEKHTISKQASEFIVERVMANMSRVPETMHVERHTTQGTAGKN